MDRHGCTEPRRVRGDRRAQPSRRRPFSQPSQPPFPQPFPQPFPPPPPTFRKGGREGGREGGGCGGDVGRHGSADGSERADRHERPLADRPRPPHTREVLRPPQQTVQAPRVLIAIPRWNPSPNISGNISRPRPRPRPRRPNILGLGFGHVHGYLDEERAKGGWAEVWTEHGEAIAAPHGGCTRHGARRDCPRSARTRKRHSPHPPTPPPPIKLPIKF